MNSESSGSPRIQFDEVTTKALDGGTLFYPHSCNDFWLPISLFAPIISDFWFADLGYFGPYAPADSAPPVLGKKSDFRLEDVEITGPVAAQIEWRPHHFIVPCVRTEHYSHIPTGRPVRIHRRRGFSTCAFHSLKSLNVFFYRRDSDEGSSVGWLYAPNWSPRKRQRWLIHEVVDKLVIGGLIVTDGSRCDGENNPYKNFRQFFLDNDIKEDAVDKAIPFEDDENRSFRCVGYAGEGNGPVLAWQLESKG